MADVTKVKLGACSITANGVDLGHTIGGAEVTYTPEYKDMNVDLYGTTVFEKVLIGEMLQAKVALAESTIANLFKSIPQGVNGTTKLTIGAKAGKLSTVDAVAIVLHPLENASNDKSLDVVLHKAISSEPITLPFKWEDETVSEVTFTALLDESKSDGNYLGLIGDSTT